jgi:hypothetical protein
MTITMKIVKKNIAVSIYCLLLLFFTSCDFKGCLTIENKTKGDMKVRYYMIDDQRDMYINEINISNQQGQNIYKHCLELNKVWSDERIEEYFSNIQKMEIITPDTAIIIEGKKDLFNYFKKHRKNREKEIVIVIKT